MRNIFIILFTLLCVVTSCSKIDKKTQNEPKQEVNDEARYELYSTQNIWTFLKLDTRTGRIWQVQYSGKTYQVQWSQKEELRMIVPITDVDVLQGDSI